MPRRVSFFERIAECVPECIECRLWACWSLGLLVTGQRQNAPRSAPSHSYSWLQTEKTEGVDDPYCVVRTRTDNRSVENMAEGRAIDSLPDMGFNKRTIYYEISCYWYEYVISLRVHYSYNTPSRTVLVFGTSIRDPLCFSFLSVRLYAFTFIYGYGRKV